MAKIAKYTKTILLKLTPNQFISVHKKAEELETSVTDVIRRLLKFIDKI